jgi:uncharacterized membrane protein
MWNGNPYMHDMGGFLGFGHGLFGFHGLLWLVLLTVIVLAAAAIVRDWRHDRTEDATQSPTKAHKHPEHQP